MDNKNKPLRVLCPYCDIVTTCNIIDKRTERPDCEEFYAETDHHALKCINCEGFFLYSAQVTEDSDRTSDGNLIPEITICPMPPSKKAYTAQKINFGKNIDFDTEIYLTQLYKEICDSINQKNNIVAATGIRTLLDTVARVKTGMVDTGEDNGLAKNLERLKTDGYLAERNLILFSTILNIGNGAVHRQFSGISTPTLINCLKALENLIDSLFVLPEKEKKLNKVPVPEDTRKKNNKNKS